MTEASRRQERKQRQAASKAVVSRQIGRVRIDNVPSAFPANILLVATAPYRDRVAPTARPAVASKTVLEALRKHLPDHIEVSGRNRSVSKRRNSSALLVLQPRAVPTGGGSFYVGLHAAAFAFWADHYWLVSAVEPGVVASHLYERIIERSTEAYRTLSEAGDRFSDLWPILIQVGQRRRASGRRGNVSDFVSPWGDGLLFGDFARVDIPFALDGAGPELWDYQARERVFYKSTLHDFYSRGRERVSYVFRTYIGPNEMKEHQVELFRRLDQYCRTHRAAITYFKNEGRLAISGGDGIGSTIAEIIGIQAPSSGILDHALTDLDAISSSDLWLSEVERSRQNRRSARPEGN